MPKRRLRERFRTAKRRRRRSAIGSSTTPNATPRRTTVEPLAVTLKQSWEELIAKIGSSDWTPTPEPDSAPPPACPVCGDVGQVALRPPGRLTQYVDCECGVLRHRRLERLFRNAFVDEIQRYRGHTFAGWIEEVAYRQPDYRGVAQAIVRILTTWVANDTHGPRGERSSLALIGEFGTGKSALATIVMATRIERLLTDALYITTPDLLDRIRATYGPRGEGSESQVLDAVKTTSLLVLDDVGAERPSEWVEEKLYQVINHRYNALTPTIFTSNYSIAKLANRVGRRIADRIGEMSELVFLEGPNLREATWQQH